MFNVNDTILYGTHGICKITDITEQKFNRSTNKYYILRHYTMLLPLSMFLWIMKSL